MRAPTTPEPLEIHESLVSFENHQGAEFQATLLRMTRFHCAFEVYGPAAGLRLSEVLSNLRIYVQGQPVYAGRAVIGGLVNTGLTAVCEATLNESSWLDVNFEPDFGCSAKLRTEFSAFVQGWQKQYKVATDYKLVVADMQSFFADLRLWLDQVELCIRSAPAGDRVRLEQKVAEDLAGPIVPVVNCFFEEFEMIASRLEADAKPMHSNYMRRQLHPWVMCAPFAYRTFHKPLGYAGDYEMVNMIARNGPEGGSLFAKVVNTWFLRQAPAQAHRNRIDYLTQKLLIETLRLTRTGRNARALDIGCGPAHEVQRFIAQHPQSSELEVTLLDFNEETIDHGRAALEESKSRFGRSTQLKFLKKSVQQILKEAGRSVQRSAEAQYDLIYCAGLFDYLTDPICRRIIGIMYEWLAPGGLLVATNVEPSNPLRHGMEHLLDWHLNYRTAVQMRTLKPENVPDDYICVFADDTGVNLFLEIRKPTYAYGSGT